MKQDQADSMLTDWLGRLGRAVGDVLQTKKRRDKQRQIEAALRVGKEQYRILVEGSIQGIFIHQDGIIRFANAAMADIFGYESVQELIGQDFRILLPPHEQSRVEGYRVARLQGEPVPSRYEVQGKRKDGTLIWIEVLVSLVSWNGTPAMLITLVDITERKRLEEQLRQAQRMEAIGTLAGGIAHDFNNILAAMLGYSELTMYTVPQDSATRRNLQEVLTAGKRAKDLVQQILTFSRQTTQTRKPIQLHPLVKEALKLLRASLPTTIDIHQHIDTTVGTVLADPTQMHQVLMNLCTNAEYAMRETGGILEVRLETVEVAADFATAHPPLQPGSHVRLTIRDTGHGIEPDILGRIFEPFFTTKGVGEGTGLGLAVVHGIITGHGGAITVKSIPGQGTAFEVYLPQITETIGPTVTTEEPLPKGKECILFVDDEEALARLGQQMLAHLGYEVVVRTSSVEALEAFRAAPQRFDLVITDQTMPNMTGEALAKELRYIRPDIPIILCTGFSHTMTMEKAHAMGINAYLLKPLVLRDLGLAIRRVLEQ